MSRLNRALIVLPIAFGIYSTHYLWLLQRTSEACDQMTSGHSDREELVGAQRICSAAGVDTTSMLRIIFPLAPKK